MKIKFTFVLPLTVMLVACSPSNSPLSIKGHIGKEAIKPVSRDIPELVSRVPVLPEPAVKAETETYTVVVNDVDVSSLLFALARDAKINVDIFQDIKGKVSINAIDQTLQQILSRIAQQVDVRFSLKDGLLVIRADEPFLRSYKIDYVNIERKTKSDNLISTQIASTGSSSAGGSGNNSLTEVKSETNNLFWATLTTNIGKIIANEDEDKKSSIEDSNQILVNRETGLITVKASEKKHKVIQQYVDLVMSSAKRQVLIEATIAEVSLTDEFQSGIDWNSVSNSGNNTFSQSLTGANLGAAPFFTGTITNSTSSLGTIDGSVRMLESFGKVKVLSTPKVMAINNQTAILKVVDNRVYFSIKVDSTTDNNNLTTKVFTSQIHSVPVGIVMQVTPYINDKNEITLNVRPTISRIINYVNDPNPDLADAGVISEIPEIQVREVESILKISSGDVAIIGGLMQDTLDESDSGIPYISAIPIIGPLFNYSDDSHSKTELVIFIRPKVIRQADINADLAGFKSHLPQFDAENEKAE